MDRDPPPGISHPELGPQGYPEGMRELNERYREEYGNPVVYITENGTGDSLSVVNDRVNDMGRQRYFELYLEQLSQAIAEGSDVRGYFIWTLVDNFEWARGFSERMGIVHVDHATQKRTIKDSAYWVREMIRSQEV